MSLADFKVEDVLAAAPPSFRERAKQAHKEASEEAEREHQETCLALQDDTCTILREEFGVTEGELSEVQFRNGKYNTARSMVSFELDGVEFQARYRHDKGNERTLVLEVKRGSAFKQVGSLADVGARL